MNNRKRGMTLDLFYEFDAAHEEGDSFRTGATWAAS
jgi:hypothetical protein